MSPASAMWRCVVVRPMACTRKLHLVHDRVRQYSSMLTLVFLNPHSQANKCGTQL
jgi:hypothetical protein